jgi:hypothetical protein
MFLRIQQGRITNMNIKNLWQKDRKVIFRQLLREYLEEGYSNKEAKRLASQETDEIKSLDYDFVRDVMKDDDNEQGYY